MEKIKIALLLVSTLLIQSCKDGKAEKYDSESFVSDVEDVSYNSENGYEDNTYCADVEYYNPNTGTRNTYTLNVEVENNELTVIHWPNGGWLDDDHFSPEELDSNGSCSFTSDKGHEYTVQINGPECSFTDEDNMKSDVEDDTKDITCPECGGKKSRYDNLCYYCKSKVEDEQQRLEVKEEERRKKLEEEEENRRKEEENNE